MRREYEMTEAQLAALLDACKPTHAMYLSGGHPIGSSPQENANAAWRKLGDELGFKSMSVRPSDKGERFFTAEPKEGVA